MVKFSTWQIAFCLFSFCIFKEFSSSVDTADAKKTTVIDAKKRNTIIRTISQLYNDLNNTKTWRALKTDDIESTVNRLNQYKREVEKIERLIEDNPNNSYSDIELEKGIIKSTKDRFLGSGKLVSNKVASILLKFKGAKSNYLNVFLKDLFDSIKDLKSSYVDNKSKISSNNIGDEIFCKAIKEIKDKIEIIIDSKNKWYLTYES